MARAGGEVQQEAQINAIAYALACAFASSSAEYVRFISDDGSIAHGLRWPTVAVHLPKCGPAVTAPQACKIGQSALLRRQVGAALGIKHPCRLNYYNGAWWIERPNS